MHTRYWITCCVCFLLAAPISANVQADEPSLDVGGLFLMPLDLTKHYGMKADDFEKATSFPWKDVPRGSQVFAGIPLEIGGMFALWGAENAKRGMVFADDKNGIEVRRNFNSLYLLHATFFHSPDGTPVADVIFHYEDGSQFEKHIFYGTHVRDWYEYPRDPQEVSDPDSQRVWVGLNSMSKHTPQWRLQLFITEIANPHPEKKVVSIDLKSAKDLSAPCILAMTTGPAKRLKVEEPADENKPAEKP